MKNELLNEIIATEVMGWQKEEDGMFSYWKNDLDEPTVLVGNWKPAIRIEDAFIVVEHVKKEGIIINLGPIFNETTKTWEYMATAGKSEMNILTGKYTAFVTDVSPARSVCLCILSFFSEQEKIAGDRRKKWTIM